MGYYKFRSVAVAYARRHKNVITDDNFSSIMGELAADESRRSLIIAHLKEKHIVVKSSEEEEESVSFDLNPDEEERAILR